MFVSLVLAVPWICNIAYCSHRSTKCDGRRADSLTLPHQVIHIPIYTHSTLVLCAWTINHLHEKLHHLQCPVTSESSHFSLLIWMLHKVTIHTKSTTARERLCGNWTQCNKAVVGECSSSTTGPWVYYCQRSLNCERDQSHIPVTTIY